MSLKTEEELANEIQEEKDTITIEGNLKDKIIKIKATGNPAWIIAIGAITIAVVAVIASGGMAVIPSAFVATGAVSILGLSATTSAIAIAVAAGGVGVLNDLRDYDIVENSNNKLVLKRS